jgi:hypothetical protein
MEANEQIQIEEGLIVESINEIKQAYLEVIFLDSENHKHSRFMKVDLSTVNIEEAIESNDILKVFK